MMTMPWWRWLNAVVMALCAVFCAVDGHLDLFMNETETKRLLGIPGELFYVRRGIVNEYALSFRIPIKSDVTEIYFVWQSLHMSPPEPLMYYSLSTASSNSAILTQPVPSISIEGIVPTKPSVFSIRLPCTGMMSGEVDVRIQLNVTIFSTSNVTVLDFRRKKICLKSDNPSSENDAFDSAKNVNQSSSFSASLAYYGATSGVIFYIGVGAAVGAIFLITIVAIVCFLSGRKTSANNSYDNSAAQPLTKDKTYGKTETQSSRSIISAAGINATATMCGAPSSASGYVEVRPVDVRAALHEIQICRSGVTFRDVLLEGTFGRIYRGTAVIGAGECTSVQNVVIKTVTDEARPDQVEVMLKDAYLMKGVSHENVSCVVMTCLDQPPLLIYSDVTGAGFNLKKFLQHCKISEVLSAQQLVYMAVQIARGLQQLHRRRLLHRDVAARNCLVDTQLHVCVSDAALSRDIFPNDYDCLGDNENRPVKWLAFEALVTRNFSTASDMWSFGVTVWELFTLGQQPYAEIDPFEMAAYLEGGYRVTQPHNCPSDLFSITACCWSLNPDERPRFTQMLACLEDFYTALGRFI